MTIDTLAGEIRGEAIHGSAAAAVDLPLGAAGIRLGEANVSVDRLDVSWRQGRLEASGVVADTVDLSVGLSLPDLSMASPGTVGSAEVDLRARGSRAQPRAELTMAARGLAIDTAATAQPLLDSLTVRVSGTPASHEAEVHAGRGGGTVDLGLAGTYADGVWAGAVDRLDLADPEAGSWQLGEPATVAASVDSVRLERTCLAQAPSLACASGLWHAGGTSSGEIVLEELTGHRLAELLPPGWSIDGRLGARASGTLEPDGTLRGDGRVDLGSGTIELGRGVVRRRLTYSDVGLEAAIDEEGARLSMATELFDESGALAVLTEIVVALPGYDNVRDPISEQALSGFVRSSVPDLGAFQYAIPDLEPVEGSVEVDVTLAGTLAEVEVEGDVRLQGGTVDVPRAGLQLRDIEVDARGRGADGIELDASARSDTGTLRVSGRAPVGPTESEPARIEVSGTRVRALGLPDASVWISPNLEVIAWPDGLRVSGEVTVPEARIELTELPATVVQASDDVVFVDDTTTTRLARALAYSVRLTLGDSVTFRGFGLSAEPVGSLNLSDGPGGTVVVTGDITLEEGRYQAYGQELEMERGRLLFAGGPPDNPGLDIRASRTASDGTVAGLEVRGTLDDPEVTIFSEPAMMESQALAYIVLGRPMNSGSESDGSRVTDAALALGLQRGNQIATRLGRSLGLDDMTVEAGGTLEEASLVAGTYVAPDLYVSYGVGLFEPVSIFRIRYMLSRRWTVRAESGKANSADLLFRIERGR
jgi:translocation and assembly module TamB